MRATPHTMYGAGTNWSTGASADTAYSFLDLYVCVHKRAQLKIIHCGVLATTALRIKEQDCTF